MEIDVNILTFGTVLALVILVLLLFRKRGSEGDRTAELKTRLDQMDTRTQEVMGRLGQISDDTRKSRAELSKALQDRLDQVSQRMGQSLETAAGKTAKSIGEVETRLKVIDEAQKGIEAISSDFVDLQNILSNKQARGAFGEFQLENLVADALPPSAYVFQATLSNGKRADCLILMPHPHDPIVVDAKFPLEGFRALMEARGKADQKKAEATFKADVLRHVTAISEKYIIAGETADSAMMFLPSEAIFAELHANFPETVDKSHRAKVWVVSPNTLMAALHTVVSILKDARIQEQAGLIQKEVGALMDDIGRLKDRVSNLSKHFHLAEKDIGKIVTSTDKITRHVERIEAVQLDDEGAEESIETIARPRLVKDEG
jgi:DNA recombination protein RmuC